MITSGLNASDAPSAGSGNLTSTKSIDDHEGIPADWTVGSEEDSRSPEKQIRARRTDDFGRCPLLPDSGLCDL